MNHASLTEARYSSGTTTIQVGAATRVRVAFSATLRAPATLIAAAGAAADGILGRKILQNLDITPQAGSYILSVKAKTCAGQCYAEDKIRAALQLASLDKFGVSAIEPLDKDSIAIPRVPNSTHSTIYLASSMYCGASHQTDINRQMHLVALYIFISFLEPRAVFDASLQPTPPQSTPEMSIQNMLGEAISHVLWRNKVLFPRVLCPDYVSTIRERTEYIPSIASSLTGIWNRMSHSSESSDAWLGYADFEHLLYQTIRAKCRSRFGPKNLYRSQEKLSDSIIIPTADKCDKKVSTEEQELLSDLFASSPSLLIPKQLPDDSLKVAAKVSKINNKENIKPLRRPILTSGKSEVSVLQNLTSARQIENYFPPKRRSAEPTLLAGKSKAVPLRIAVDKVAIYSDDLFLPSSDRGKTSRLKPSVHDIEALSSDLFS